MNDEDNLAGQEPRPASVALPPVSIAFGSMGSTLMAVGSTNDGTLNERVQYLASAFHAEPAHIGCAPNNHDFVETTATTGMDDVFGRRTYRSLVYCRKCPYHYFPQQNE